MKAQDGDSRGDKLNPAGQIEYSIVSTHKHFKIDSETGWLSTNKVRGYFFYVLCFFVPKMVLILSKVWYSFLIFVECSGALIVCKHKTIVFREVSVCHIVATAQ